VEYVVTRAKIDGRKKRTRIRDQQDGSRSQKGDLPTILRKQKSNMDGYPKINSKLETYLFGSHTQVQQFTQLHT
jgi:hypothetical protein